ncbi:MAG: hypothetical protein VR64_01820 [Desulfatitalea sp. BRH_c12]|nr:MAG: hypothetical protein VR64_01820 [Desulfatitalea sp. BRH_c12]
MFYLIEWIALIVLTLVASFAAFFWAFKNGQFEDQKRAAYFPLTDLPPDNGQRRRVGRIVELYVLSFGALMVLGALIIAVLLGVREV